MSKNGKPVTKHIVGLGNVTSYEDVPDAKEANMRQERPQVHVSGAGAEKHVVGDEYHSRPATADELQAATAKAIAEKSLKQAVAPKAVDRDAMAESIAKAVAQGAKGANGMPVGAATTKKVGPNDMPVTGDEADNAPPSASAKKRANVPVVSETDHDITVESEIDQVEPIDERYGTSAGTVSRRTVTTKMKSITAGERVYVPGVKGIGIVQKSVLDKLTVEMENDSIVTVEASEVTPLGQETKGWYGSMKGKKKKKVKKSAATWLPRAVVQTEPGGKIEWVDHAPLKWLPEGPYMKSDKTLAWLPNAVDKSGADFVWKSHEPLQWVPEDGTEDKALVTKRGRMTWAGANEEVDDDDDDDDESDIRMPWAGERGTAGRMTWAGSHDGDEDGPDTHMPWAGRGRMTWAGAPDEDDDADSRMTWAGRGRMTWAGGPLEWLPRGKSWAGLATKSDAEELKKGYAADAKKKKKDEEKD